MSKRDYKLGPNRSGGSGNIVARYATDEVEAYYALKREQDAARRKRCCEYGPISLSELKVSRAIKSAIYFGDLAQAHGELIADAWATHNPQLAELFSQALKKAQAENPGEFTSEMMRQAWDAPELRAQFSKAVSEGLRKMWADPANRALSSERAKVRCADPIWRAAISERVKKQWADPNRHVLQSEGVKRSYDQGNLRERRSSSSKKIGLTLILAKRCSRQNAETNSSARRFR